jgi:hypothetical protein
MTVAMNDPSTIRPATRTFPGADHQIYIDGALPIGGLKESG